MRMFHFPQTLSVEGEARNVLIFQKSLLAKPENRPMVEASIRWFLDEAAKNTEASSLISDEGEKKFHFFLLA